MKKQVYLGADHRGFRLKEVLKVFLTEKGVGYQDLGADEFDPKDDYPVYAERVASVIAKNAESFGVLICGSGVGVDVIANKFDGVRASLGKTADQVKAGRADDDMNILVIASDFTEPEEAEAMVGAFLETKFEKKARHQRRLEDIKRIEANN